MIAGVMFGITHSAATGQPMIREPRVLKVGIGLAKGRAYSIYIFNGKWIIRYGVWEKQKLVMKTVFTGESRAEAEEYHRLHKQEAAMSDHPQKLPFFTFSRRSIMEEKGKPVETFEPDFAAIEAHGECPREIDIVLMGDNPYAGNYQMWGASSLKCSGDGIEAKRTVEMPPPGDSSAFPIFKAAKDAGEKFYDLDVCWTNGCPYAGTSCKPGVTLNFQLANAMRIGATAYFHTTSIRSATQIFSSLETIRMMVQRVGASLVGLPLKMVLSPFKTNHDNKPATQYGVSLELRAEDMKALRARLSDAMWTPQQISAGAMVVDDGQVMLGEASATSMVDEFYPEFEEEPEAPSTAETATTSATEALAAKLAAKREPEQVADAPTQPADIF